MPPCFHSTVAVCLFAAAVVQAADAPEPLPPRLRLGSGQLRHGGAVTSLAFSGDAKLLASAGRDDSVRLWDVKTGESKLQVREEWACCVALTPDGKTLAAGSGIGLVRLWNGSTGQELFQLRGHQARVTALAFSHDGGLLASTGDDQTAWIWEVATGRELHRLPAHDGRVQAVAFSPDDAVVATVSADKTIHLWRVATGVEQKQFAAPSRCVALVFAPDGKALAGGAEDGRIYLWDTASGNELRRLEGHAGPVRFVAYSGDGKSLMSVSRDATLRTWDVASGKEASRIQVREEDTLAFARSTDGKVLATAGAGGHISVWPTEKGERSPPAGLHGSVTAVSLAEGGKVLVAGATSGPTVTWELTTGRELRRTTGGQPGRVLAIAPDGSATARLTGAGAVELSDASGKVQHVLAGPKDDTARCAAFASNGKIIGVGYSTQGARLFDAASGKEAWQVAGKDVLSLCLARDGKTLAWTDGGGGLSMAPEGGTVRRLGRSATFPVAFSPDGKLIAAGLADGAFALWDVASGSEVRRFQGHDDVVHSIAFSPDARYLVSGGGDAVVRLWEVLSGKPVLSLTGHSGPVTVVTFLPGGRSVVSGGADTRVLVWDAAGPAGAAPLAAAQLEALWQDLGADDGEKAYRASWLLSSAPAEAIPHLRDRLRPLLGVDAGRIGALITDLDAEDFAVREKATTELEKLVQVAEPALRRALQKPASAEARQRLERVLEKRKEGLSWTQERLRSLRAVVILERAATPEARRLLEEASRDGPDAELTEEARAALARLRTP